VTGDASFDSNTLFVDASANSVGIATSSPLAKLSVGNGSLTDTNLPIQISSPSDGGQAYLGVNRNGGYGALFGFAADSTYKGLVVRNVVANGTTNADGISFVTNNNSVRMHIKGDGNVGINNTSPSANLEITQSGNNVGLLVAGGGYNYTAKFESSDSEANIIIEDSNSTDNGNMIGVATNDMYFITNATERMRILSGGGLTFNGDTAAANALDDYEEGTWTPAVVSGTVTAANSTYTKIGRLVHVVTRLSSFSETAAAQIQITGLPYTIASSNMNLGSGWGNFSEQNMHFYAGAASTSFEAYYGGSNYLTATYASLGGTGANIIIKLTYEAA
jgi:hypothetical protein